MLGIGLIMSDVLDSEVVPFEFLEIIITYTCNSGPTIVLIRKGINHPYVEYLQDTAVADDLPETQPVSWLHISAKCRYSPSCPYGFTINLNQATYIYPSPIHSGST